MEKKLGILLILGIGGLAAYHLLKKPASVKSFDETPSELSREIESDANVEKVQRTLPRFGVPKNIISERSFPKNSYTSFASASGYKNYVDVKNNSFFKPELGAFHK